jgi:hypothetical protein
VPLTVEDAASVVNDPVAGVVAPTVPLIGPLKATLAVIVVPPSVVNVPAAAAVPPMAGGEARNVVKPAPLTVEVADSVVNAPVEAVVAPTEALFTVPPLMVAVLMVGDVRVLAVSVCVPLMVTMSVARAVSDTTADPLKEMAAFALLELITVRERVVPDDV